MDVKSAKRRLLALQEELASLSEAAKGNRKPVALDQQSIGRLSRMDSLQVQAMDQAAEQRRRRDMLRIETALQRVETDDFGFCVTCDEPIGEKRLELDPATPLCINCAK
jgi:DnaK suppressor protein